MKHVTFKSDEELEPFSFDSILISKCIWIDGKPYFLLNSVCEWFKIPVKEQDTLLQLLKKNIENYGEHLLPVIFENITGIAYAIDLISLFLLHSLLQYEHKEYFSKQLIKLLKAYCNNQLHKAMLPSTKMILVIQKIKDLDVAPYGKRGALIDDLCKKTGKSKATIERWITRYKETGSIGYYYQKNTVFSNNN